MAKTSKKARVKVGIKDPQTAAPPAEHIPPGKPPKKIRMLISCSNQYRSYTKGEILDVPQEVSVKTARSWIGTSTAEEVE